MLSERELNRAMLARQLLLERSRLSIPRALERMGGIQNQYALNAYIRLRSCLENFERDDLTRALERRTVVQGTLLRSTIHMVSAQDYWLYALGVRRARREWTLRLRKDATRKEMIRRAARVRAALLKGPLPARELMKLVQNSTDWLDVVRIPPSGHGSGDGRTCMDLRKHGLSRAMRQKRRDTSIWCGAISVASARRR